MNSAALLTHDPVLAKAERARRELARRHLIDFNAYISPDYNWSLAHLKLLSKELEDVEIFIRSKGEQGNGRLIVMMPPQHGKTETITKHFSSWLLGRNPNTRIILGSYNDETATENSQRVRNMVMDDEFAKIFGKKSRFVTIDRDVQVSEDSKSKKNWDIAGFRGGCRSAGVGGGITGKPADIIIIDDPHKDRDDVNPTGLQRVLRWWNSQVVSRIRKKTAVIIVHTRWDPDDLIGSRLKLMVSGKKNADQWRVLCLPAVAMDYKDYAPNEKVQREKLEQGIWLDLRDPLGRKPGEPLWADEHPLELLESKRANDEFEWWAMFMQQPRPLTGGFFERDDFIIVDRQDVPEGLQWFRYVDLALSESSTADYNASVAVGMDLKNGDVYLRDMLRLRGWMNFRPLLIESMLSDREHGTTWGIETVSFQALAFQELARDPRLAKIPMIDIKPEASKGQRAQPLRLRGKNGQLKLVRGAWNSAFIDEAVLFKPDGSKRDDQIDTASGGFQMVADLSYGNQKIASSEATVVQIESMFQGVMQ